MQSGGSANPTTNSTLEALFRAEYVGMVRLAFTLVGDATEAEDLVQDAFVEVSRRLDEIRRPGAYLRQAVVSRCRSSLRRRRLLERRPPPRPEAASAEVDEFWDVLDVLSEDRRIAVVLRFYLNLRASEIAEVMGVSSSTVRSHLRRALATLREELDR
ncbi:MAG: sigma-70 family RNA polymerase sigma factor [Actinomycetota bacterium]